jgi:hypothetical protein
LGALEDGAFLETTIAHNLRERQRIRRLLVEKGFTVAESAANFLFIDCAGNSQSVAEKLLAGGVIDKPWTKPGFENWMCVTIGSENDNNRLLSLFQNHEPVKGRRSCNRKTHRVVAAGLRGGEKIGRQEYGVALALRPPGHHRYRAVLLVGYGSGKTCAVVDSPTEISINAVHG